MLGVCRVCTLRVYRQEKNILDGCPIDNGADYTSKSGSLVSVLQYVLFSVQCCIYHSITVVKHCSGVEVILQHNCHLATFTITVIVSSRCSDICQIILYNVTY